MNKINEEIIRMAYALEYIDTPEYRFMMRTWFSHVRTRERTIKFSRIRDKIFKSLENVGRI